MTAPTRILIALAAAIATGAAADDRAPTAEAEPIDGTIYEQAGVAMKPPPEMMGQDDKIVAGLLNYIRNGWGNKAPIVTAEDIKAIREREKSRKDPWMLAELAKRFPINAPATESTSSVE